MRLLDKKELMVVNGANSGPAQKEALICICSFFAVDDEGKTTIATNTSLVAANISQLPCHTACCNNENIPNPLTHEIRTGSYKSPRYHCDLEQDKLILPQIHISSNN